MVDSRTQTNGKKKRSLLDKIQPCARLANAGFVSSLLDLWIRHHKPRIDQRTNRRSLHPCHLFEPAFEFGFSSLGAADNSRVDRSQVGSGALGRETRETLERLSAPSRYFYCNSALAHAVFRIVRS